MNYAQLRSFHAIAQEGGFSAAARKLKVSQPSVTYPCSNPPDPTPHVQPKPGGGFGLPRLFLVKPGCTGDEPF